MDLLKCPNPLHSEVALLGLSPAVFAVAVVMQERLDANAYKNPGYKAMDWTTLKASIREEILELDQEVKASPSKRTRRISNEAADICNYALFTALNKGVLDL